MTSWVRILALCAAVVVAALLLKLMPGPVVLLLFIAGGTYINLRLRRQMRSETKVGAELLGFRREEIDPFGILGYPLELFARVGEPAVDELVWGPWHGLDVRVFGISFRGPSLFDDDRRSAIACAMAHVDAELPGLVVEPQAFLTVLEGPPSTAKTSTADEAADADLNVWCDDPAFAAEFLSDEMRDWLRSLEMRWGVEVRGRIALVYGSRPETPDVVGILEVLEQLIARIPLDVLAAHPPSRS
jgi:hypothetical protein